MHKIDGTDERSGIVALGREIELESFRIIDAEMGSHSFSADEWHIVRRVIHTSGDFDYADRIRIQPQAIARAKAALAGGATIFTDTRMIKVGLSPWRLGWFGNEVITPVSDPKVRDIAEKNQTTRSAAAFRSVEAQLTGNIIAIGNAPTALHEVIRMMRKKRIRPALVIGVPVGFVQAREAKDSLWMMKSEQPCITVLGRKGGSTIAVAILHALLDISKASSCP